MQGPIKHNHQLGIHRRLRRIWPRRWLCLVGPKSSFAGAFLYGSDQIRRSRLGSDRGTRHGRFWQHAGASLCRPPLSRQRGLNSVAYANKRKPLSKRASRAYGKRNANLRELGFANYSAYLASPLWRSIRQQVLADDPVCSVCRTKWATQVHHRQYDKDTLLGKALAQLTPICAACHHTSEVGDKGKRSPHQANGVQTWMTAMLRRQRWEQANFHLENKRFLKGH